MIISLLCLLQIFILNMKCDHNVGVKNKNALPYFTREDLQEGTFRDHNREGSHSYDSQSNLVSLLVNNVKEVFDDVNDVTELAENFKKDVDGKLRDHNRTNSYLHDSPSNLVSFLINNVKEVFDDVNDVTKLGIFTVTTVAAESLTPTTKIVISDIERYTKITDNSMDFANNTINYRFIGSVPPADEQDMTEKQTYMLLAKEIKSLEKSEQKLDNNNFTLINSVYKEKVNFTELNNSYKRSCISCNNVMYEECNDPRNILIPSVVCPHESDVCYSQHTPFGIVDRGCFNVNDNLNTYVCSCNLCNYISISEMPYIFSNKRDWVDNVVELSRTKNFRKSVFKDMACMRCEVNTTKHEGDSLDSVNCLEGNIGSIPTEICEENEICAVKAIKNQGYIWRGCVRTPLYNYWWALCDSDLCNYDTLVSIYDFV